MSQLKNSHNPLFSECNRDFATTILWSDLQSHAFIDLPPRLA